MPIIIEEVEFGGDKYKALLNIRNEVLRKPIGMELRPKDIATGDQEYHLAAFDNQTAIGCVLLRPLNIDSIQLRQMAVSEAYRGQAIGAKLVKFAEEFAQARGFKTLETRARKTARGFYAKSGYESFEQEFIDEHTLKMAKSI